MSNVVRLSSAKPDTHHGPRRPPVPPGNARARDYELIAVVTAIPDDAALRYLSEWDRGFINALSADPWYRGRWARLTPNQRTICWRIIDTVSSKLGFDVDSGTLVLLESVEGQYRKV